MGDFWRQLVERMLPWYEPAVERRRNRRTEAIRLRSIAIRKQSERVGEDIRHETAMTDYQAAERARRRE